MDVKAIWEAACQLMKNDMSEVTYSTWIASALKPLDFLNDQYYVETVADYYHTFVVPRYATMIASALQLETPVTLPTEAEAA